MIDAGQ